MKKVAVMLKNKSKLSYMKRVIRESGMAHVHANPDFVISLGGDGTFLISERKYPGIPKLLIRDSLVCNKCISADQTILSLINSDHYKIIEEPKVQAIFRDKTIIGANDIVIRNKKPNQAIRLDVYINGKKTHEKIIADGVVIATPFGSSGYFQSITRKNFDEGLGVAFSNPVVSHEPVFLGESQRVRIRLVRGDAQIAADNDDRIYTLKEGESVKVQKAKEKSRIIIVDGS